MAEVDAKINLVHFKPDDNWQHVIITQPDKCQECRNKPCLTICPSGVFVWNLVDKDPILVFYKQCVECGACRLVCPLDNIEFSFPHGGYGVNYHEG